MIQGIGKDSAEIMFVGDSAHKEDFQTGHALSGYEEEILRSLVRQGGHSLDQCYRTLFIKDSVKPFGKSKKKRNEVLNEIKANGIDYESILAEEILTFKPNIIVPMGDLSLQFLTGYKPLRSYRGSVLPLTPLIQHKITDKFIRVIPTLSPRDLEIDYPARTYTRLDFQKICRLRERTNEIEEDYIIWVCRSLESLHNFLKRQINPQFMVFDIETYGGIHTAISLCFDGKEAISIPIAEDKANFAESYLMFTKIAEVLNSNVPKVNQNIKYDWSIVQRFGWAVQNIVGDTTISFSLLYPELPKNLGFQNSIYTDIPYFKDESKKQEEGKWNPKAYTRDTLYIYNAKDALATWQIHAKQEEELAELGLDKLYHEKMIPLLHIYKEIDDIGIRVDTKKRDELSAKYSTLYDLTLLDFRNLFEKSDLESLGLYTNPENKFAKQGKLIYEVLKFPIRYKSTESGKSYKTDKDTLDDLLLLEVSANKHGELGRSALKLIIKMRKIKNVLKYINTPLHPGDLWKGSYNLTGTETGRTTCSKSLDELYIVDEKGELDKVRLGRSLQTISKHGFAVDGEVYDTFEDNNIGSDIRSMFVPRHGKIFIEGDKSQAESRVVAVLAEDYELLASHDQKPKIHAKTAGAIFNLDPNTITKDGPSVPGVGITYYDTGKKARHAYHYRMKGHTLATKTHLGVDVCNRILKKFDEINPSIKNVFHFQIDQVLRKSQELRSPNGRRRQFFDRYSEAMLREALAQIPQSTVSDDLKFSMIGIKRRAPWTSFLVEAHDSALAEVDIARKNEYHDIFKEEAQQPIDFTNCSLSRDFRLTIPVEVTCGYNWKDMEEMR